METYKQEMARITAPETLRARVAALPQENAKPKRSGKARKYAAIAAVIVVVLVAGVVSVPMLFGVSKSAVQENTAYDYGYDSDYANSSDYSYTNNAKTAAGAAAYDSDGFAEEAAAAPMESEPTPAKSTSSGDVLPEGRKLIRDATLSMETKEFDAFLVALRKQTASFKGYTENSSLGENYDGTRHGSIVVRVPAAQLDAFLDGLEGVGTVTSREESLRDVTQEYIDMDSRIRALETEQKTLLELMEKAKELTDVLEIQSRLSEVRAQLESYKGQMKALENQIDYSRVTIFVEEVKRYTPAEKKSFGAQLRSNLAENFYDVGQGLRNFALNLLSALPYLLVVVVLGGIVAVVIVLIRRKKKRF